MRALCSQNSSWPKVRMLPLNRMCLGGAACVHYLAGKKSITRSGKCHSGLARQEISKIYACCLGTWYLFQKEMRKKGSVPFSTSEQS